MPKKIQYDLPPEFANAFSKEHEHLRPTRVESNRLRFPSPLPEFPGTITAPMFLSPEDYSTWWELAGEGDENPVNDNRHWSFADWQSRFHIIKHWDLKDSEGNQLDTETITEDGMNLPDMRIITWVLTVTQPILSFSVSIPNLPKPLIDTTKANETTAATQKTTK